MIIRPTDIGLWRRPEIDTAARPVKAMVVFPPSTHAVRAMYTFHNEDGGSSLGHKPPLGPLYVATYARRHSPHEVKVLDCQVLELDESGIRREIEAFMPEVVGVCAWTDFWYDASRCIAIAKSVDPRIHVCVGGPHAGIFPEETLRSSGCDSIIQGDGEVPFLWLLNAVSHGKIPNDLPGLRLKSAPPKSPEEEWFIHPSLDDLGAPDRTLLPHRSYRSLLASTDLVSTMITSRGCPHRCTFCKLTFQKTLSRSAKNVVEEFEEIASMGIREVEVYDDTFTWSRNRLMEICDLLIERKLGISWSIRDRVTNAAPDILNRLKMAGCSRIHYGIESGSDATLARIKKGITRAQAEEAVKAARRAGMEVLAYFMIGLPGEREADVRESIRFAKKLAPDFATFSVAVPYPGTEMYADALREGIIDVDYWNDFARNPTPNFVVPRFYEEHLSGETLLRLRDEATRSFYFRPTYMLRQMTKVRSVSEFGRKAAMALGLFKIAVMRKNRATYEK